MSFNYNGNDGWPKVDNDFPTYKHKQHSEVINNANEANKTDTKDIEYLKNDIICLVKEIKATTNETSNELCSQAEIITKLDPKLNRISDNLEKSDTLVAIIRNKFNKFAFWKGRKYSKETDINKLPSQTENVKYSVDDMKPTDEYIIKKKADDDEFYNILMDHLTEIQNTNKSIGNELDAQNSALEKMAKKVDTSNKHLDDLTRNINQLLH
jgi:chromosome segregation ATPase